MICNKLFNTILKAGWRGAESNLLKLSGSSYFITSNSTRSLHTHSSATTLQSSDVELSYMLYPLKNEAPNAQKTPVIFLHGLFGAKGNLHSVSKHLSSAGRRIVTFDARNHGSSGHVDQFDFCSMAQDLQDLINELGIEQPSVLAHSMGGKSAMTLALQHPDSLSSLIVADVNPYQSPGISNLMSYAKAMKKVEIPQNIGIIKARKKVEVQLASSVPDRGILSFLLTNLIELEDRKVQWRLNIDSILNSVEHIGGFPTFDDSQQFTKPTLFVYGQNSAHYKDCDQGRIKALFPSAQFESIPDAGHFLHAEKPIEFVNIVEEFLKSLESSK